MKLNISVPPNFDQVEVIGEIPDLDLEYCHIGPEHDAKDELMNETSATRRVIRTHSIPENVGDATATITTTLMAQRRGNGAAKRGDEWADADSFVMSKLHANEHAKIALGPNQTKKVFLHLARRYTEQNMLPEILRCIDVEVVDTSSVSSQTIETVMQLVADFSSGDQALVLAQVLKEVEGNPEILEKLIDLAASNPNAARLAATSLNLARYSEAIEKLQNLIGENALEHEFQKLLDLNPWMFGGEYSAREDRRRWTRDENADFMMRRTVDEYLELIEIKRPIATKLFIYDTSHESHYPCAELSKVLGQVVGYIDEIDAERYAIQSKDGVQINKLRAKIIIGLDHDQGQVDALRQFNSHLHRIEITTFDQLLKTAVRVRGHLQEVLDPLTDSEPFEIDSLDDLPF